jgi:hypothetical protein
MKKKITMKNQKYYYDVEINKAKLNKAAQASLRSHFNKHIGSDFDDFAKDNNIELKRDINWALKMLNHGKIMTREGNRSLILFPPQKSNNEDAKITVDDLFAEDWIVLQNKTFKEVLADLHAGKTIRRISWDPSYGIGKFAKPYGATYLDLLADDWESIDVVAEVNQIQQDHLKDRNAN